MNQPIAIINLNGDVLELNTEAKQLLKNNESIQIKQRRFAFNKSRQQQFELNLIELERNYQNNHDLAYNERSKTMMIDHHLFLTLDLLSPEKTNTPKTKPTPNIIAMTVGKFFINSFSKLSRNDALRQKYLSPIQIHAKQKVPQLCP